MALAGKKFDEIEARANKRASPETAQSYLREMQVKIQWMIEKNEAKKKS